MNNSNNNDNNKNKTKIKETKEKGIIVLPSNIDDLPFPFERVNDFYLIFRLLFQVLVHISRFL